MRLWFVAGVLVSCLAVGIGVAAWQVSWRARCTTSTESRRAALGRLPARTRCTDASAPRSLADRGGGDCCPSVRSWGGGRVLRRNLSLSANYGGIGCGARGGGGGGVAHVCCSVPAFGAGERAVAARRGGCTAGASPAARPARRLRGRHGSCAGHRQLLRHGPLRTHGWWRVGACRACAGACSSPVPGGGGWSQRHEQQLGGSGPGDGRRRKRYRMAAVRTAVVRLSGCNRSAAFLSATGAVTWWIWVHCARTAVARQHDVQLGLQPHASHVATAWAGTATWWRSAARSRRHRHRHAPGCVRAGSHHAERVCQLRQSP